MRFRWTLVPGIALLAASLGTSLAFGPVEWPTLRQNAARTGRGDALPGPLKPSLRWQFRDPESRAAILSSPAVAGARLFVGAENCALYCLDAETGALRWRVETDWEVFSSPAVASGLVYVGEGLHHTASATFRCRVAETGAPRWAKAIAGHVESSPAVAGGRVYFGGGPAGVFCLDAARGDPIWNFTGRHVDGSPAVSGGKVLIGTTAPSLLCLDARTGRKLWEAACALPVWGAPAVHGSQVWITTSNGGLDEMAARPRAEILCLNAASGARLWRVPISNSVLGSVALHTVRGRLHAVFAARDGQVGALDAATGARRWIARTRVPFMASPALDGQRVYLGGNDGRLRCLSAVDGRQLWVWEFPLVRHGAPTLLASSPALADGRVYLAGTNGIVACVESP